MPTSQISNGSIKNLYNAWKGTTGNPATTASLAGIAGRSSGQISLCKDFIATGVTFDASSYQLGSNQYDIAIAWNLNGSGTYLSRLKQGHSVSIYSDDVNVIVQAQSHFGDNPDDSYTYWDTGDPEQNTTIYLSIVNGYLNTWVGTTWSDVGASVDTVNI